MQTDGPIWLDSWYRLAYGIRIRINIKLIVRFSSISNESENHRFSIRVNWVRNFRKLLIHWFDRKLSIEFSFQFQTNIGNDSDAEALMVF